MLNMLSGWIRTLCSLSHPLVVCSDCHINMGLILPTIPLSPFFSFD